MLEGQRILVTGATGQVARPLAEKLNENNEVWAAARFSDPHAKADLEAAEIRTVYFSLGDEDLSSLPDVDYVFHCGVNQNPETPDQGIAQNAEGTGFLMQRYRDVRGFLHMSSSGVYRVPASSPELVSEDHTLGGHSVYAPHYAMSKLATEAVVRFQARALGIPTIITRLDVAYGSHGHGGVPMVVYEFMKHGMAYTRAESGDSYCTPIHEDDIVEQVQNLIANAQVPAPVVNLGGDEVVTVEEIIAYVEELTGLEMKMETGPDASWGMKALDNTKRKSLAGPCRVTWKEGVRSALAKRSPDAIIG
ncbi:MAG: NAD(P)-dependent oxidoreductase [Myxococcota bacterium]|jgi:nucleoside-diphosphate-sugar epimerase|nr:NAD(P)-dependent oxidoreductase [Myxococcota bacterium]